MKSKKFIAGVLAIAMVFGSAAVLPVSDFNGSTVISVCAEDGDSDDLVDDVLTYGNYKYIILEDGTVEISNYTGDDTEIEIPSAIDGKAVTSIGKYAFNWCDNLTTIIIPNSVISIENNAFNWCNNLTNITIPNSVTNIGGSAFEGCIKLESITIPDGVANIGDTAFYNCIAIKSVIIPKNVTTIGDASFGYCYGINGGEKVSNFFIYCYADTPGEQYALDNGFDYELLDEPVDSSIGDDASEGRNDSSVEASSAADAAASPAPVNSSTTDATDFKHTEVTDGIEITDNTVTGDAVKIPENINGKNVVSVGDWAFAGMKIKSVELPSVLKNIGEYAFFNCPALTSVTIPKSVENIGDYAFGYYLDEDAVSGSSAVTLAGAMAVDVNQVKKVDGFKIYCYTGTAGEKYAVDNGFDYVLLDKSDFDTTTSSKSEATSNTANANKNSTANPSTGAAAGLALATLGLGAVVVTKRRK